MCARRFLMVVFVLTLLVAAGAFAIFQYGDRVLIKSAVPKGHFEAPKADGAPTWTRGTVRQFPGPSCASIFEVSN
jgi:hypothetical protein